MFILGLLAIASACYFLSGAAALAAAVGAASAFSASLARMSCTRIVKLETRLFSRGESATVPATISTNSGLENHGVFFDKLRSKSETRSFDCATPCKLTDWLVWRIDDM
jgi:hypothetical protein